MKDFSILMEGSWCCCPARMYRLIMYLYDYKYTSCPIATCSGCPLNDAKKVMPKEA